MCTILKKLIKSDKIMAENDNGEKTCNKNKTHFKETNN